MYELKTLLPAFDITVPKCMYAMKSLALKRDGGTPEAENASAMTKLEERQEVVIKQLHELRNQLQSMRSSLNVCGKTIQHTQPRGEVYESLPDIVINAHPKFIPYALLAIKNIWKDTFNIDVKCYSHSTIVSLDQEAIEFQKQITANNSSVKSPGIKVTLIWKNTEHTEMISSPTMYVPIYGEVNIIRYLARVGPQDYRYEDTTYSNDIDVILDICYQLLRCQTAKSMQPLLRSLNNRLQKQKYFTGDQLSIADVAVCSSIRRMPAAAKNLTENMNKWLTRVKQVTLI